MGNINVSVIIPTYNRPQYLRQAVASVVHQTYRNMELIIVNDGNEEQVQYPNSLNGIPVRTFHNQSHSGASACRNVGISKARYDWVAFLDDDDIWPLDKLESQIKTIISHPEVDFIYNDYYIFDSRYRVYDHKRLSNLWTTDREDFIKKLIVSPITGPTSSFLIKKNALRKINGFDESMPTSQDYDLSLRLFKTGSKFYCIPKPLLFYRSHNNKVSLNVNDKVKGRQRILSKKQELFPELWSRYRTDIAHFHYYALTFSYIFGREGNNALQNAKQTFRLKKNFWRLLKFILLIWVSQANVLPAIIEVMNSCKQLKYYRISGMMRSEIKMRCGLSMLWVE